MHPTKQGFTLIELTLVLAIVGILLVPLVDLLRQGQSTRVTEANTDALEAARNALLQYAALHKGCLPHAADFEGGIPDTNNTGGGSLYSDTGSVRQAIEPSGGGTGQRAGDIPWADLGLAKNGLDGESDRIQYYVASPYTSPTQTRMGADNAATRDDCRARIRKGVEAWDGTAAYRQGDIITSGGLYYVASSAIAAGITPPSGAWALFATTGSIPPWNATTNYTTGSYVTENGVVYRALQNIDTTLIINSTTSGITTTTTTSGNGPQPSLSPTQWRAVGLPGQTTALPAWQTHASQGYRRGEVVMHNGRVFRAIAATTGSTTAPVAGTSGPDWDDLSIPASVSGTVKLLETRSGPAIGTAPGSTASATHNVLVLIAPGKNERLSDDRVAVRDDNHQTCSTTSCSAWTSYSDTNADTRTFSSTPDLTATPTSPDTVLAISAAAFNAYLAEQGLTAPNIAW